MQPPPAIPSPPPRRVLWALLLTPCLLWNGLVMGAMLGSPFVPKGSGLAGGAIVLAYGLAGIVVAAVLAAVLIWKLSPAALRLAALAAGIAALLSAAGLTWRQMERRAEQRAEQGLDKPLPPNQSFSLRLAIDERDQTRAFRDMEIQGVDWSFRLTAAGPGASICRGRLIADEANGLIERLAALRKRLKAGAPPCESETEPVVYQIDFAEAGESWEIEAGFGCLQKERETAALGTAARAVVLGALSHARLSCE